jgi:hypothetical protein
LGAPLFVFGGRKRGLNAEDAKVRAQSSLRRIGAMQERPAADGGPYKCEGKMELTEGQMRVVERLFGAGFRPIAIPPYESALIIRKGECVALLGPVENGGLRLLAPVTFLVDGNLSVRLKKNAGDVFVWKKREVAATEEMLKDLEEFRGELVGILQMGGEQ